MRSLNRWPPRYVLTLCCLLLPARGWASDLSIGPLCIENVEIVRNPKDVSATPTVLYERATITYSEKKSQRRPTPTILVLAQPVVDDPDLPPSCVRALGLAEAQGIGVILRGRVVDLQVKGRIGRGLGNRFWIDAEGNKGGFLKADIGQVTAGLRRVAGGRLDLAGGRAWIRNVGDFLTTPDRLSGTFEIESYNPTITAAHVELPGGAAAATDLKVANPDARNLTIRVDMASGRTTLWSGDLTTKAAARLEGRADLPLLQLDDAAFNVERLAIEITRGKAALTLHGITGTVGEAATTAERLSVRATKAKLAIQRITATATHDDDRLLVQPRRIDGLAGTSETARLTSRTARLVEGPMTMRVASLTDEAADADLRWTTPKIHGLPLQIPAGAARQLQLLLKGPLKALEVRGGLEASAMGLAGIEIEQPLAVAFTRTPSSSDIMIPIAVDVPKSSGKVRFIHDGRKVLLEGALEQLRLRGDLKIPIADPGNAELSVPADGMKLAFGAAATLEPLLAGTKPTFASTGISLGNPVALAISRTRKAGHLMLESSVLVIGEPVLKVGEGATAKRSTLTLNAEGSVMFQYPLDKETLILARGRLVADKSSFSMEPGGSIDVGGTTIADPSIRLERLFVHVDRFQPTQENPTSIATASGLTVDGARFDRARKEPTETAWQGTPTKPFTVASIVGEPEFTETSLEIQNVSAFDVRMALKDARITIGRELALDDAVVSVAVAKLRSAPEADTNDDGTPKLDSNGKPVMVRREHVENLTLNADGRLTESEFSPNMQLDLEPRISGLSITASGRSDRLSGEGRFSLSPFSGTLTSPLEFEFPCSGGNKPRTNIQYRLSSGGSVVPLTIVMSNGKTAVSGPLGGLNALFTSNMGTECHSEPQEYVISEERDVPIPPVPCGSFTSPRICTTARLQKVALKYHGRFFFLALSGHLTVATPILTVRDAKTNLCYLPPAVVVEPTLVSMGVSPQIDFSGPVPEPAQRFVNDAIHHAAVGIETSLATGLTKAISHLAQGVSNHPLGATAVCLFLK